MSVGNETCLRILWCLALPHEVTRALLQVGRGLANTINYILSSDDGKKVEMLPKAVQQANKFSWDVCVNRTTRELLKAVEECGHYVSVLFS